MANRYFLRRFFAYIIDFFLVCLLLSLLMVGLNSVFETKFIAPKFFHVTQCKKEQIITPEKFRKILPVSENGQRAQAICKITSMGVTTYHVALLQTADVIDGTNFKSSISFYVNEDVRHWCKSHKPYEFGIKVSVATTLNGTKGGQFAIHAKALPDDPYDGHTLENVLPDIEYTTGAALTRILADDGYPSAGR